MTDSRGGSIGVPDVAVVGGGLIGLAVAHELALRGASVRVLETAEPGAAASWAGAGMLAPFTEELESPELEMLGVDSLARYHAFVETLRASGGVDARLRLSGILHVARDFATEARLRARMRRLAERGVRARWLAPGETFACEPTVARDVRGAALVEEEGHVDNRRLGRALRAACEALGVRIERGAGPTAIDADARRVRGVRTPHGFFAASAVVNAAGAWAGGLAGVPEDVRVPIVPVKGQMLALALPPGLVRRVLWTNGIYAVPRDDGRLLVGATVEPGRGFDVRVTARGLHEVLDALLRGLPALGDFTVGETWAGVRPGSADGLPYLGATALDGYYVAAGHYRNGILLAPVTAHVVADAVESGGAVAPRYAAFAATRGKETRLVAAN